MLALVLPLGALTESPASAFEQFAENCGNKRALRFAKSGDMWNRKINYGSNREIRLGLVAEWGYNRWWNDARNWRGQPAVDRTSGTTFTVRWTSSRRLGGSSTLGITKCTTGSLPIGLAKNSIWFNSDRITDFVNGRIRLEGLSAHEFGHALGLGHSGGRDSFDADNPPTMATCSVNDDTWTGRVTLSQDDRAGVAYLTESLGGYHGVTANNSFEDRGTALHWGRSGVSSWNEYAGGVDGSRQYLRFSSAGNSSSIFSTSRVTNMQVVGGNGSMVNSRVRARANARASAFGSRGSIRVVLTWRPVEYADGSDIGCNFYGDIKNSVKYIGSWRSREVTCSISSSSSWKICDVGDVGIGPDARRETDAIDVRVRVYNRMKDRRGAWTTVDVDRVRARVDFFR